MNCRVFFAMVGLVTCFSYSAMAQEDQEKAAIKERLTAEYLEFVKGEGFVPSIDKDGDITFKVEGKSHYLEVYGEEFPQYFAIFRVVGFPEDEDRDKAREVVNTVNSRIRSVKAVLYDKYIYYSIEVSAVDSETFKCLFSRYVSQLDSAVDLFAEEYYK